ncbi:PREDICTED: protein FAM179A [Corvus brachyrhynchos]|uniref:protein FAM179A n=1 Tax=Corvus brachyrhynchos TaxID=85066 RepID=UPI0008164617|nr:PREDICTED: protein FAM179A [Corvus brachyrhynchos]
MGLQAAPWRGALPGAAALMADPLLTVTPQTATGAERREEPLRGKGQKDGASLEPQQSLLEALSLLSSDDWELKEKGLFSIKHLAESHSEVLLCRLREVCLALTNEVTNLRSKVSYSAIVTLGELFVTLQKDMDSEVDEVARVLLQMVWNSPEFVQKAASHTLGVMVEHVTPARAMTALMDSGVQSRHVQVRKCAAQLLLSLMEKTGVTKLAGTATRAGRLIHMEVKLTQDKDTRCIKNIIGFWNNLFPPVTWEIFHQELRRKVKSTSDGRLLRRPKAQVMLPPAVEETEPLQKLYNLLEAKEFKTRMEGVALLLDLCKSSPQLVSTNTVQIFDYFVPRICDTHKKVKQKALDVLAEIADILKDGLNPVVSCLVEGITNNLNSKDPGVYAAAVKALEESMAHLDKVSLMKEFSHRRSELKGQALLDVTEHLSVLVGWVYPRSPEVVQRYALPVLWSFLGNKALPVRSANVRSVVTKLACALYKVMGAKLRKHAASQPPHVRENLSDILGW